MELMEGLTVVATESSGDVGATVGIIFMGFMMIVFGGIFFYLSDDYMDVACVIGVIWAIVGVFILILGILCLAFSDTQDVYTVIVNDSVNFNEIIEKYEIIEYEGNLLKIQPRN